MKLVSPVVASQRAAMINAARVQSNTPVLRALSTLARRSLAHTHVGTSGNDNGMYT